MLLQKCELSDPVSSWEKYKKDLSKDFKHHGQLMLHGFDLGFNDKFIKRAFTDIENRIVSLGKN